SPPRRSSPRSWPTTIAASRSRQRSPTTPTTAAPRRRPRSAVHPSGARRISRQLTVHYKRDLYVLEDTVSNRRLRGTTVVGHEAADGTVTIRANGQDLSARLYPKDHSCLHPGGVIEHEHPHGVLERLAAPDQARH